MGERKDNIDCEDAKAIVLNLIKYYELLIESYYKTIIKLPENGPIVLYSHAELKILKASKKHWEDYLKRHDLYPNKL